MLKLRQNNGHLAKYITLDYIDKSYASSFKRAFKVLKGDLHGLTEYSKIFCCHCFKPSGFVCVIGATFLLACLRHRRARRGKNVTF